MLTKPKYLLTLSKFHSSQIRALRYQSSIDLTSRESSWDHQTLPLTNYLKIIKKAIIKELTDKESMYEEDSMDEEPIDEKSEVQFYKQVNHLHRYTNYLKLFVFAGVNDSKLSV